MKEEANVDLIPEKLSQIGVFRQTFDDKADVLLQIHVFATTEWEGIDNYYYLLLLLLLLLLQLLLYCDFIFIILQIIYSFLFCLLL